MKSAFDDSTIDVPCPHCGKKLTERVGKLKLSPQLTCRHCNGVFDVKAEQFQAAIKKADQSLADLRRRIGRAFK